MAGFFVELERQITNWHPEGPEGVVLGIQVIIFPP